MHAPVALARPAGLAFQPLIPTHDCVHLLPSPTILLSGVYSGLTCCRLHQPVFKHRARPQMPGRGRCLSHHPYGRVMAMVGPTSEPQVMDNSSLEAALLEALIGVQGRGRNASRTQLLVTTLSIE